MTPWICAICHESDVPRSKKKRDICEDCLPWLEARNLAWCTRGQHRVNQDEMSNVSWCKACHRAQLRSTPSYAKRGEYAKQWRARHPERVREYNQRPEVRAAQNESRKRVYQKNIDKERAARRARYWRNRERYMAYARQWRRNNTGYGVRQYRMRKLRLFRAAVGGNWRQ
jgi:hypothetical protein